MANYYNLSLRKSGTAKPLQSNMIISLFAGYHRDAHESPQNQYTPIWALNLKMAFAETKQRVTACPVLSSS
jgi:hypothetical protein